MVASHRRESEEPPAESLKSIWKDRWGDGDREMVCSVGEGWWVGCGLGVAEGAAG